MEDGQQNSMRVGAIIQARMQSTRLPGKILMGLPLGSDKPLIKWITDELRKSNSITKVVVATSENEENDTLEEFCLQENLSCFRGSEEDVLSRFINITEKEGFDVVIRLTADNPFLDINLLEKTLQYHLSEKNDYTKSEGLPLGMNFEIISGTALCSIKSKPLDSDEREHVTLYVRRNSEFKQSLFKPADRDLGGLRLTVDYPSDFLVASQLLGLLRKNERPSLNFISRVSGTYPWLFDINTQNEQKIQFSSLEEEKAAAIDVLRKRKFNRIVKWLNDSGC